MNYLRPKLSYVVLYPLYSGYWVANVLWSFGFIDNFLFLAQLWKYDSSTKLLTSKLGIWTSDETWNIPVFGGAEGNIEGISSNQVLGLKDDATETGTEVILEAIDSTDQQIWSVDSESEEYEEFFTLKNKITQKILTAKSETMMTIEGM